MANMKNSTFKVVIVGAGISGLSTAVRLIERGYRDVVILEATDRIGGRIQTKKFGDGWVELGAQWIHGQEDNAAYDFAVRHDLVKAGSEIDLKDKLFCTEDGIIIDKALVQRAYDGFQEKLNAVHDIDQQSTVNDYLNKNFLEELSCSKCPEELAQKKALLEWCKYFQCSIDGCDTLTDMKIKSLQQYHECPGNQLTNVRGGYTSLVNTMANKLTQNVVFLQKPVVQVRLDAQRQVHSIPDKQLHIVEVVCKDGSMYEADHVVVTCSLGYLKHNAATMFYPPLPLSKIDVIQKLGFGTVDKIFLEFEQPFWSPGASGYSLVWTNSVDLSTKPWYHAIFGFYTVPFASNVLCGWIGGAGARQMESLSDKELEETCIMLLHRFTGITNLPTVKAVTRSSWQQNTYTKGSYSFYSTPDCCNSVLAEPIYITVGRNQHPALLFAGEATHPIYFSTVHGAIETGYREANRIIAYQTAIKCTCHKL